MHRSELLTCDCASTLCSFLAPGRGGGRLVNRSELWCLVSRPQKPKHTRPPTQHPGPQIPHLWPGPTLPPSLPPNPATRSEAPLSRRHATPNPPAGKGSSAVPPGTPRGAARPGGPQTGHQEQVCPWGHTQTCNPAAVRVLWGTLQPAVGFQRHKRRVVEAGNPSRVLQRPPP